MGTRRKTRNEAVPTLLAVFVCITLFQTTGFAETSGDNLAKPASEKADQASGSIPVGDNTMKPVAGGDNTVGQVTAYDGMTDSKISQGTWGIRVERVRLSAGGAILDFRYRIMDSVKAKPFVDRRNKPYVLA